MAYVHKELRRVVEPAAVRMAAERATAQDLSDMAQRLDEAVHRFRTE